MSASKQPTIYFGYGSNLWLSQMRARCPTSNYLGLARLNSYQWIISERGYANVVETPPETPSESEPDDVVYGLVFSLQPSDEEQLDGNEGVPWAYTKELLEVNFWPGQEGSRIDVSGNDPGKQKMLVYIDRKRTDGRFKPHNEYVVRMNNGIADALAHGVPDSYVNTALRRWIPEQSPDAARGKARQQALRFEDEN